MIQKTKTGIISYLPGLQAVLIVAVPSIVLKNYVLEKYPVSELFYAIIIGLIIKNVFGVPDQCRAGITFSVKKLLKLGIILMGIRLSFLQLVKGGANSLLVIVPCIILALTIVYYLSKKLGLHEKLGVLIGVGTCICGNSAIIATAPAIEAKEDDVAFAVATITFFGTIAVILYPIIGRLFHMSDALFGIWSGVAINDTSQVIAASGIYSEAAQNVATVTKLIRNLFMVPAILILGFIYARKNAAEGSRKVNYRKIIPWFVLGFVIMAIARTLVDHYQFIDPTTMKTAVKIVNRIAGYCIALAISGVGLNTSFGAIRKVGLKPLVAGFAAAIFMTCASMILIKIFGLGT